MAGVNAPPPAAVTTGAQTTPPSPTPAEAPNPPVLKTSPPPTATVQPQSIASQQPDGPQETPPAAPTVPENQQKPAPATPMTGVGVGVTGSLGLQPMAKSSLFEPTLGLHADIALRHIPIGKNLTLVLLPTVDVTYGAGEKSAQVLTFSNEHQEVRDIAARTGFRLVLMQSTGSVRVGLLAGASTGAMNRHLTRNGSTEYDAPVLHPDETGFTHVKTQGSAEVNRTVPVANFQLGVVFAGKHWQLSVMPINPTIAKDMQVTQQQTTDYTLFGESHTKSSTRTIAIPVGNGVNPTIELNLRF